LHNTNISGRLSFPHKRGLSDLLPPVHLISELGWWVAPVSGYALQNERQYRQRLFINVNYSTLALYSTTRIPINNFLLVIFSSHSYNLNYGCLHRLACTVVRVISRLTSSRCSSSTRSRSGSQRGRWAGRAKRQSCPP